MKMTDGEKMIWAAAFVKENDGDAMFHAAAEEATAQVRDVRQALDQCVSILGEDHDTTKMLREVLGSNGV